jgi:hypothetical protein
MLKQCCKLFSYAVILTCIISLNKTAFAQQFTKHIIDGSLIWASGVHAADIDRDNDIDLIATGATANEVDWYENNGSQTFIKHIVDNTLTTARSAYGVDLDRDSDMDIIATGAASTAGKIVRYENNGSQVFTPHIITQTLNGAWDVSVIDLDHDNDLDIVATASTANVVMWYENNGSQIFTEHTISALDGAQGLFVVDLDNDNDLDIVAAAIFGDMVVWYENNGSQTFTQHIIDPSLDGANDVAVADIDNDGDKDIVTSHSQAGEVVWYENTGNQTFSKHVIASLSGARAVFVADLNNDNRKDIVAVGLISPGYAMWYENTGGGNFSPHTIDTNLGLGFGIYVIDLDQDSDLDIMATGGSANTLVWYESNLAGITEENRVSAMYNKDLIHIYPNPFNSNTIITYEIKNTTNIILDVYDVNGKLVKRLAHQVQKPGHYTFSWNRTDEHYNMLPDGVYFLQFITNYCNTTNKIVIND